MKPTTRKHSTIIYSINTDDVENVVEQEFSTSLTKTEMKEVEDLLGAYIDWYGSLTTVIESVVNKRSRGQRKALKPANRVNLRK